MRCGYFPEDDEPKIPEELNEIDLEQRELKRFQKQFEIW